MRKTALHRTTGAVVAVLLAMAVLMAVLRNTAVSHEEKEGTNHVREREWDHAPQIALCSDMSAKPACSRGPFSDTQETRIDPGLKGLFHRISGHGSYLVFTPRKGGRTGSGFGGGMCRRRFFQVPTASSSF